MILLKGCEDLSQHCITLIKPVAVIGIMLHQVLGPAFSEILGGGDNWHVRRADRKIEKKWFVRLSLVEPLNGLFDHLGLVLHGVHIDHHAILLDDGSDVPRMGVAEEVIKSEVVGSPGHFCSHRNGSLVLFLFLVRIPVHAEMPFADAGGCVSLLLEKGRDGHPILGNNRCAVCSQHPVFPNARGISPGEDAVARWSAD